MLKMVIFPKMFPSGNVYCSFVSLIIMLCNFRDVNLFAELVCITSAVIHFKFRFKHVVRISANKVMFLTHRELLVESVTQFEEIVKALGGAMTFDREEY
jgi:hypothetical protein